MAAEPNSSFHQEDTLASGFHRHDISFQSGAVSSTSEMLPMGGYYGMNSSSGNLMFCDSSSIMSSGSPTTIAPGNSSGSLLLDSVPGLKHDAGLAVEWTEEEQYKLEDGLVKFKEEPSIMKYVKIAAILRDKTVRDVALRCRWMARKRRKQEESFLIRKANSRKDKFMESSSKATFPSASIPSVAPYSFQQNQMDQNQRLKCQVLGSKAKELIQQNLQAFNQIDSNITCLKESSAASLVMVGCSQLQDNIDLLCRARENINNVNVILNNMREFSGKMRQMQDLPVSIDQNLANRILPRTPPILVFGVHKGLQVCNPITSQAIYDLRRGRVEITD
ncbi:hypothetical protein KSS87_012862 [Heliosperma pusillum]|nr:hypothetical protein KSS87_012862 [Heliosperma pusillum]